MPSYLSRNAERDQSGMEENRRAKSIGTRSKGF